MFFSRIAALAELLLVLAYVTVFGHRLTQNDNFLLTLHLAAKKPIYKALILNNFR